MQDLARPMQRGELNDLTIRFGSMSIQELDALRTQVDREHQSRFQRALEVVCRQFGYAVEDTLSVCRRGESTRVRLVIEY